MQSLERAEGRQAIARNAGLHRRPCNWGNPFVIGRDGTRADVIAKHRAWVVAQPALMSALDELRGHDLVCWCAPLACHGDVLVDLANKG